MSIEQFWGKANGEDSPDGRGLTRDATRNSPAFLNSVFSKRSPAILEANHNIDLNYEENAI